MAANAVIQYHFQFTDTARAVVNLSGFPPLTFAFFAAVSVLTTLAAVLTLQLYKLSWLYLAILSVVISFGSVFASYVYGSVPEIVKAIVSPSEGGNYLLFFGVPLIIAFVGMRFFIDGGLSVGFSLLAKLLIDTLVYKKPSPITPPQDLLRK
jgi:hypothetical protein